MLEGDKAALRRRMRALRPGPQAVQAESRALCQALLAWPVYHRARCVAAFAPLPHEGQILPVLRSALAAGKTLLLPRLAPQGMAFHQVTALSDLRPGAYGILEPPQSAPLRPLAQADLIFVPLEAVDPAGRRLGKGGGYYDRALRGCPGLRLGIALRYQLIPQVPAGPGDEPLDGYASPDGVHMFNKAR